MEVTVYSPPADCTYCMATKIALRRNGVPFESVTASDAEIAAFKAEGLSGFPVVRVDLGDGATWTFCGYRHDDIKRLKELRQDTADQLKAA